MRLLPTLCLVFFSTVAATGEVKFAGERILTTIMPEQSDFHYGRTEWRVKAVGDNRSEIQPDFRVPPLIGPLLIKHKMAREARDTILNIKQLAGYE